MIESYVRTEDNIQIESYRNNGTYIGTNVGSYISYRAKSFKASFSAEYNWDKYNGQSAKGYVDLNGHVRWDFGNFSSILPSSGRTKVTRQSAIQNITTQ